MLTTEFFSTFKEGNRLEAKKAQGGLPQSVWETYSAFANTDGGTIVLGLEEVARQRFEVVGVKNPDAIVKHFWDTLNNPSKVSANLLTGNDVRIEEFSGKPVVIIEVPRADRISKPVYVGGNPLAGTYRRNGEGDYHCTIDEYKAMVRDSSSAPLDLTAVDACVYADLCQETVRAYRTALASVRPDHPWTKIEIEEMLLRLGALTRLSGERELHPTRAGLLMFGFEHAIVREFPDYFLDYRDIRSNPRWDDRIVSNDGEWSGNLFDFWQRVSPRLTADLKRPFQLGESPHRIDSTPMHKAVREGLANCLMHADYYGKRYTTVVKRVDRIEFGNPGGLRIAPEVVVQGGYSDARNPTIMKMFGLINVCEKAGGGFDAIRHACDEANARPFALTEERNPDRTNLTLYLGEASALMPSASVSEGAGRLARVSREQAVLDLLGERGYARRVDIEELLGIKNGTAKKLISSMLEKGLISTEGAGRATVYRLADGSAD